MKTTPTQTPLDIARELLKPKAVLFLVSVILFVHVPYRYGALCLYNWSDLWQLTFLVMLAALALWISRPLSYAVALALSFSAFQSFLIWALKIHGFIHVSVDESKAMPWKTPGEWWLWGLTQSPYEFIPPLLGIMVFCYTACCMMVYLWSKGVKLRQGDSLN